MLRCRGVADEAAQQGRQVRPVPGEEHVARFVEDRGVGDLGGSSGLSPRTILNSANGLHARQIASAVCRARNLPLCQITAGAQPRVRAHSARCAACARPSDDNGR